MCLIAAHIVSVVFWLRGVTDTSRWVNFLALLPTLVGVQMLRQKASEKDKLVSDLDSRCHEYSLARFAGG